MGNFPELIPSYWASVSGGKDSLFMLKLILDNPERYPLDGVVHFELEIDYPFIKDVVDFMESACKSRAIRFVRIRPRKSWLELYEHVTPNGFKTGFPTRKCRWCNSKYKLDAKYQLEDFLKKQGFRTVHYIGYCADEVKRFSKRAGFSEIYPVADFGISESYVLEWAKKQPIFNNYYIANRRCGCMWCPLASRITYAYLAKYYPLLFNQMLFYMRDTEKVRCEQYGFDSFSCIDSNKKYNADYLEQIIYNKWIPKLNKIEKDWGL